MANPPSMPFSSRLLPDVVELLRSAWAAQGSSTVAHPGDLFWMLRPRPHFEPTRDIHLWSDGPRLVGMAWFDGAASGELVSLPGAAAELVPRMMGWLESTHMATEWGERFPKFSTRAWDGDMDGVSMLEQRGYHRAGSSNLRFEATPGSTAHVEPPDGFRFEPVTDDASSLGKRARLQRAAFEGATADAATWKAVRRLDGYSEALDVMLVTQDGEGAAFALCWYDAPTRSAVFEPVGTANQFHGRGLGKAVMAEGMRRLFAAGATTAIVTAESDNPAAIALYGAAGFTVAGVRAVFERDLR